MNPTAFIDTEIESKSRRIPDIGNVKDDGLELYNRTTCFTSAKVRRKNGAIPIGFVATYMLANFADIRKTSSACGFCRSKHNLSCTHKKIKMLQKRAKSSSPYVISRVVVIKGLAEGRTEGLVAAVKHMMVTTDFPDERIAALIGVLVDFVQAVPQEKRK